MPSTYSSIFRLELQAAGENDTTWGTKANAVFNLIEDALGETAAVTMTDANYTLTTSNGAADEARCAVISLTGTLSATRNVVCPTASQIWTVHNATTGGQSIVFKTSAGTGVTIPNGMSARVRCDGTNVVQAETYFPAITSPSATITGGTITGITDLAVADGGTGASTQAGARTNLGLAIGTDVQAYSAKLAAIAALAVTDGGFIVGDGTTFVLETGATARTSLGLGTMATANTSSYTVTGLDTTYAYRANNLSDLASASTARTNLGLGTIATQNANNVTITGGTFSGSSVSATTVTGTSDARLKDDIHTIPNALALVTRMRGVEFVWNEKADATGRDFGLVAQELQELFPELVVERGDVLTVKYMSVIGLLVEAVKELERRGNGGQQCDCSCGKAS